MKTNNIKEMEKHIVFDKNCDLTIKENDEKSYSFVVENNCKVSVLLDITSSLDLNIVVKDNGDLKISILNSDGLHVIFDESDIPGYKYVNYSQDNTTRLNISKSNISAAEDLIKKVFK